MKISFQMMDFDEIIFGNFDEFLYQTKPEVLHDSEKKFGEEGDVNVCNILKILILTLTYPERAREIEAL